MLTSEVRTQLTDKEKPVLKVFHDLLASVQKVRGERRDFFWNELTNLVTRLAFIKTYKETNDIYTEELENRFEKERKRRQQLEFDLGQKRNELSRLKAKYENLLNIKKQ